MNLGTRPVGIDRSTGSRYIDTVKTTADHTDEQQEQFRQAFARRRRNTVMAMIVMIPSGFFVGFGIAAGAEGMAALGIPLMIWLPLVSALFAGSVVTAAVNWRCPSCGASLPRFANPRQCDSCGAALQ